MPVSPVVVVSMVTVSSHLHRWNQAKVIFLKIEGMEASNGAQVINGMVPLAEMFGYATSLRSKTQGRGVYTMQFSHYEPVPKSVSEKIIEGRTK